MAGGAERRAGGHPPEPVAGVARSLPRRRKPVGSYRLGVLGGDGIGPEVTREGLKVLEAVEQLTGRQGVR